MKNNSKYDAIAILILLIVGIAILALSFFIAKWIAESDMPVWLKYWLLRT